MALKRNLETPPKEDSECAFLVRGDNPRILKEDEDETPIHSVAKYHEHLLDQAGFGAFHLLVLLITGLGLAADAVELLAVGYILPSAEHELCMEDYQKGWLSTISFIGMLIGALLWGILGDRLGRRRTLLTALASNGIFGVIAAFMPTYSLLLLTRFCSSVGIGGSLPIVVTFYSEFLIRKNRGRNLTFLFVFWALGGLFVTILAWAIIPRSGATIMDTKRFHFGKWRKFLLVCYIPAIVSAIGTSFLPESARFLLEMGRHGEALYVYKQILSWNNAIKSGEEYQLTDLEVPNNRPTVHVSIPSNRGILKEMLRSLEMCWNNISQVFSPPHIMMTLCLLTLWSLVSFGFYGISMWIHECMNLLEEKDFTSQAIRQNDLLIEDTNLNLTIENQHFYNTSFLNVRFVHLLLSHSTFQDCSFINCTFSNIRSSRTYFRQSNFYHTEFFDTDLYNYKFQSCYFNETCFYSTKGGCTLDFDINFKFAENLYAQLAIFIGTLISLFFMDNVGRVKALGFSLVFCCLIDMCLWFAKEKYTLVVVESIFTFFSIFGWNALNVISAEAYPASIRTTSYGIFVAVSRLAAILSRLTFTTILEVTKVVPIIISTAVMITGVVCVTRLPETKDYLV